MHFLQHLQIALILANQLFLKFEHLILFLLYFILGALLDCGHVDCVQGCYVDEDLG